MVGAGGWDQIRKQVAEDSVDEEGEEIEQMGRRPESDRVGLVLLGQGEREFSRVEILGDREIQGGQTVIFDCYSSD